MERSAESVPSADEMYKYVLARSRASSKAATHLEGELAMTAKWARENVLRALELAIGAKLFKVVIYTLLLERNEEIKPLVESMVESFQDASRVANESHQALAAIIPRIDSIKTEHIVPIIQRLEVTLRHLEIKKLDTNMRLDRTKRDSATIARSIASLEAQIENPNSELNPARPVPNFDKGLADGFAWIDNQPGVRLPPMFTGGKATDFLLPKGDPDKERELREKLSEERMRAAETAQELAVLQARSAQLEIVTAESTRMQNEIRHYLKPIEELYLKANPVVELMRQINESVAAVGLKVEEIAKLAISEAGTKSAFLAGVLDILLGVLIDRRLEDEVRLVLEPTEAGYKAKGLSVELKEKLRQVEQALDSLP